MNINRFLFIVILSLSFLASCKKDNVQPVVNLTAAMARDSLYNIMNEWYYWNDSMPAVNKDDYPNPDLLMKAMLYNPRDRWSFVADYNEFKAEMQGSFVGHGFRIGLDDDNNARITLIYSESPLYEYGVRRGWIVKKINNQDVASILHDSAAYSNLIGPREAGITNKFLFQTPAGKDSIIMSTKTSLQLNSVILADTLHLSTGITTGHIVFDAFISPSENELLSAFEYFKTNGVQDLILDLRYNSGGYLYIAQELASYIAGNANSGSDFIKLIYNNLHQESNGSFKMIQTPYPLGLSRLVVITTRETASASECVMNGLKPYMDVISIGDKTNGKPVGMGIPNRDNDIGKKYYIAPVTFQDVNKNDEGDFYDGIVPYALVSDDITRNFNDREELCLKAAISYLETGSIPTKGASEFKRHPQFSEKPAWMKNAFVLDK
jgi:carboxyl-terminal processing protease